MKGFTLIETVIYTALIGIVLTGFITFAFLISGAKTKNYVMEEVNVNTRTALDLISRKIREAESVISPSKGISGSSLILRMPDSSTAAFDAQDNSLRFNDDGNIINATSDEVIISDLIFVNLSAGEQRDNIRIIFNMAYGSTSSMEYMYDLDAQTAVSLR